MRISGILVTIISLTGLGAGLGVASASALQDAQRYFESGDHRQALASVDTILAKQPDNPEARFLKGIILVQQGEDDRAIEVFTRLTREYPELPEPYNNLAVIYASRGDYDHAQESLKAALKTHPSYTTAYVNLGDIYAKLASEAYQQALELDKRDSRKIKIKLALINKLLPVESVARASAQEIAQIEEKAVARQPAVKVARKDKAVATKSAVKVVEKDKVVVTKPVVSNKDDVIETIKNWARAWSSQKVEDYLSYYDQGFKPVSGTALVWRKQRYIRLNKPGYIRVTLPGIKVVNISNRTAEVHIKQVYESDTYRDVTLKRIELRRRNNGWKIYREAAI